MKIKALSVIILHLIVTLAQANSNVEVLYKWKAVEFENLPLSVNSMLGLYRYYDVGQNNIMQMGYHPLSGLMIVTVTRARPGVPITLGAFCADDYPAGSSPKIWAFPNNDANLLKASDYLRSLGGGQIIPSTLLDIFNQRSNSIPKIPKLPLLSNPLTNSLLGRPETPRLISTYTVNIDEKCNRAFTIDTGVMSFFGKELFVIQRPSILVYDLPENGCRERNFKLIRRTEFPDDIAADQPAGILYMTLDFQSDKCDDLFIYITNVYASYLAVYDYKNDDFWVFRNHPSFQPEMEEAFITDEGFGMQLGLGVVSVALSEPDSNGDRTAYYMPSTGTKMYSVSTKVLKDKEKSKNNNEEDFQMVGFKGRNSQTSKTAVDYTHGVVFFLEYQSNRVRCWNMAKPFTEENIGVAYQSPEPLYGMMLFIDSKGNLWFNKSHTGLIVGADQALKLNKDHSIIYRVSVVDAIKGTVCENLTSSK